MSVSAVLRHAYLCQANLTFYHPEVGHVHFVPSHILVFRVPLSDVMCPHKKKFFYSFSANGLARQVNGLYSFSGFQSFCMTRPGSMENSPIGHRTRTRPS
nr:MAG TPA: hypothetical protein [Caudoviricetes sp.]